MLRFSRLAPRLRLLPALLALTANLIAAGVPLLHAAAHREHGASHHAAEMTALAATDHSDHGHGEIHPPALHDHGALSRGSIGFSFIVVADLPVLPVTLHERRDTPIPVPRLSSRAPPPGDPARAPPLA